jgi:UDP-N-acetylglucosamine 2-epimerase
VKDLETYRALRRSRISLRVAFGASKSGDHGFRRDPQEECAVLGKLTLVTREVTERPEAIEGGSARLVGTDSEALVRHTIRLVRDNAFYARMTRSSRLFGDSRAGIRIARILVQALEEAE